MLSFFPSWKIKLDHDMYKCIFIAPYMHKGHKVALNAGNCQTMYMTLLEYIYKGWYTFTNRYL